MRLRLHEQYAGCVAAIVVTVAVQTPPVDERAAAAFLRELQAEVARDDRAAVSARIQYPLTAFAADIRIAIPDAAAFLENYDVVFSPGLKAVIAQAAIAVGGRSAPAAPVAVTADAMTIGDAVRIEPRPDGLRITRITVPLAAPPLASAPSPSRRPGGAPAREPLRVLLGVGRIQRAGALGAGGRDAYVLAVTKNQLLEVRLNGVNGRDVVVRIFNTKTRAPVDARARDGVRAWVGRVPEDGDYRIEVVRLAQAGAGRLPYDIIISLR